MEMEIEGEVLEVERRTAFTLHVRMVEFGLQVWLK
jgi:hypothetical protein